MTSRDWLKQVVEWAHDVQLSDLPSVAEAQALMRTGSKAQQARATLQMMRTGFFDSSFPPVRPWQLANACAYFATESRQRGLPDLEKVWLLVAHRIYADKATTDPHFAASLARSAVRLAELGVLDPTAVDPLDAILELPAKNERTTASEDIEVPRDDESPAPLIVVPLGGVDAGTEVVDSDYDTEVEESRGTGEAEAEDAAHGDLQFLGGDGYLASVIRQWAGGTGCDDLIDGYAKLIREELSTIHGVMEALDADLDEDVGILKQLLSGCTIPEATDRQHRAQETRSVAARSDTHRLPEDIVRRRWLTAGLWNYALWQEWATNKPQVQMDIIGYLGVIQIYRRFDDKCLDLLLAVNQLTLNIAYQMPEKLHEYVRTWVRSAIGTFLLIGGPDPALPSESSYDARIHMREDAETGARVPLSQQRVEREEWGATLLDQWRHSEELRSSAAFSLAILSGWDQERLRWILENAYHKRELSASSVQSIREAVGFWEMESQKIISGAQPVRIASNPWKPDESDESVPRDTVTSARDGKLRVPSSILRAMASELTERDQATTVQGKHFKGRRVPTYLLFNNFGPSGVLKLDFADRVLREKKHYDEYARKRLHPSGRPSDCRVGKFKLFVGNRREPLQAILTPYVFAPSEDPMTLTGWMAEASEDDIPQLLEDIFLKLLKPWLAHVRRQILDIRMEYPMLRPREADPDAYDPERHAATELQRLLDGDAEETLGISIQWDDPDVAGMMTALSGHVRALKGWKGLKADSANPFWLVAEIAEMSGRNKLEDCIYAGEKALSTFSALTSICHGDLHGDNILCSSGGASNLPRPILIDFEATHEGHICRDFARLEAAIVCQAFQWDRPGVEELCGWMGTSLAGDVYKPPVADVKDSNVRRATIAAAKLRDMAFNCGQHYWPLQPEEYRLALLAVLLPIVRYTSLEPINRALALILAAQVAGSLASLFGVSSAD